MDTAQTITQIVSGFLGVENPVKNREILRNVCEYFLPTPTHPINHMYLTHFHWSASLSSGLISANQTPLSISFYIFIPLLISRWRSKDNLLKDKIWQVLEIQITNMITNMS